MHKTRYQKYQEEKESTLWEKYCNIGEKALIALLDDTDGVKRRVAASYLQLNDTKKVIQLAKMYCYDKNYKRRVEGVFILGQIKLSIAEEKEIIELLCNLVAYDKSLTVRSTAIASVGHRVNRNNKYGPVLISLSQTTIQDKSPNVRLNTAFALSCISDESSIPLLLKLLEDADGNVRNWAAFAINVNGYNSPKIRDSFASMLLDSNQNARTEAIIGLAKRQDRRVTTVLIEEFKKDVIYDDYVEAAGVLDDIALLPVLEEIVTRFDKFDELNVVIEKLKNKRH